MHTRATVTKRNSHHNLQREALKVWWALWSNYNKGNSLAQMDKNNSLSLIQHVQAQNIRSGDEHSRFGHNHKILCTYASGTCTHESLIRPEDESLFVLKSRLPRDPICTWLHTSVRYKIAHAQSWQFKELHSWLLCTRTTCFQQYDSCHAACANGMSLHCQ